MLRLKDGMALCAACRVIKPLSEFYIHKTGVLAGHYLSPCKACRIQREKERYSKNRDQIIRRVSDYNKAHPEKRAARRYARGENRPMSEAKDCAAYLGIHIAERVLINVFKNAIRMPHNNPGYDFICGRGYKVDVKSSCLIHPPDRSEYWSFHIGKNTIADYFLCLAFDDRGSLNPRHMWLVPGSEVNSQSGISVANSPDLLERWAMYERSISEVVEKCNAMRGY